MMSRELAIEIRARLLEGNACPIPSITSKLPFPYHWVPGELRMLVARVLFSRNLARLREETRTPRTYADNYSDTLAARALAEPSADEPAWRWPEDRGCAIVLSHDVDTTGQTAGIERLRKVAEKHGMRATFSFVGTSLGRYASLIADLRAAGHEIALHDRVHDNRVAFLTEREIVERLSPLRDAMEAYGIRGFRSPSWYTSMRLWNALRTMGFHYDMSVLDSWPFFEPGRNYGVATLFPYRVDGLAILPNTIPFDDTPRYCGYALANLLEFWTPKLDWIARNGGLIMFNAHPDRWWSGSAHAAEVFEQCVAHVLSRYQPARMTAGATADHLAGQAERGALVAIGDSPRLEIPRGGRPLVKFGASGQNPILTPPAQFLA